MKLIVIFSLAFSLASAKLDIKSYSDQNQTQYEPNKRVKIPTH